MSSTDTNANTETAKNMRSNINLTAKLDRKGDSRTVSKRDGGSIDVCDAYLKDDVGELKLTLWGDDIEKVKVGDTVKITNGYTSTFRNEVSISTGKYGTLEVVS